MHYRTGTIALTNGSAAVVGIGTDFISGAAIGECVQVPDGKLYEILSIQSATGLTLGTVYLGSTGSGNAYSIIPTQSYIRDLASQAATLVNGYADVKTNALVLNATAKTSIVDADVLGGKDSVTGLARVFSLTTIKAALKTYFDSVTTTLTNKTLITPVINSPTGIVKGDVGLGNVDNTSDATKDAATTTLTNKTITDPTIDGVKYLATQSQLTFALDYALDQAGMANKRVTDATTFQTQTGTASFTQAASTDLIRTYATATVNLSKAFKNTDYQVVIEPVSATPTLGFQGEVTVQSRTVNSFVLQMSGSATACSVRWKVIHPNAEGRMHVVLPTAQ